MQDQPIFTHKVSLWYGFPAHSKTAACWNLLPRLTTSRSNSPDKSNLVRFEPGSHDWKASIITSQPHIHMRNFSDFTNLLKLMLAGFGSCCCCWQPSSFQTLCKSHCGWGIFLFLFKALIFKLLIMNDYMLFPRNCN